MRGQGVEPIGADDVMQMGGPERVPPQRVHQLRNGAISGDRVEFRLAAFEPVFPLRIRAKHRAPVEIGLDALLLPIIKPVVIGLPNIQPGVGDAGPESAP